MSIYDKYFTFPYPKDFDLNKIQKEIDQEWKSISDHKKIEDYFNSDKGKAENKEWTESVIKALKVRRAK